MGGSRFSFGRWYKRWVPKALRPDSLNTYGLFCLQPRDRQPVILAGVYAAACRNGNLPFPQR